MAWQKFNAKFYFYLRVFFKIKYLSSSTGEELELGELTTSRMLLLFTLYGSMIQVSSLKNEGALNKLSLFTLVVSKHNNSTIWRPLLTIKHF